MTAALFPVERTERCVRYRFRYSQCERCAATCPHDAVQLSDEGARIDSTRCRNCGLCVGACPTSALQSAEVPGAALVRSASAQGRVRLACRPSGAEGDEIVACLGALDPALLAFLASRRVGLELAGSEHCEQCEHAPHGGARLSAVMDAFEQLRGALGGGEWASLTLTGGGDAGMHRAQADRRQLFRRMFARPIAQAMAPQEAGAVPARAVRSAPHFLPLPRELLKSLWQGDALMNAHVAIAVGALVLGEGCNGCELCERVCPTGALRISEQGELWALQFESARCVGCGVCVESCQPKALTEAEQLSPPGPEPITLTAKRRVRCNRCGRIHVPESAEEHCAACRSDDNDFAAIFG